MATVTIFLPKGARADVKEGDKVQFGQRLCREEDTSVSYDLVKLLSVPAKDAISLLRKKPGEKVDRGDVLVERGLLFGIGKKKLTAPFDGKIIALDEEKGVLTFAADMVPAVSPVSPVDGFVKKIDTNEIKIDFAGNIFFAKQGIGGMERSVLVQVVKADGDVSLSVIKEEYREKALLGGHFGRQVLEKAYGLGVASVLATVIDDRDFAYFEQHPIFNPSLLLLAKVDYDTLTKYKGKEAVIEGLHKRIIIQE